MKRRFGEATGGRDGEPQRNTRQKEIDNPYLAHVTATKKNRKEYQDPSLFKRKRRDARGLVFHQEEEEEAEREELERQELLIQAEDDRKRRAQAAAEFASSRPADAPTGPTHNLDTPGMEWWDIVYLPKELRNESATWTPESAPYDQLQTSHQRSTLYVEHPVPIAPTKASMESDEPLKLYQTKAELKKIRRQNRALLNKEKQDKIALGLIPPPPPKVKISNLLRVLSSEHAADPSAIEAKVKAEMEQRERQHIARNLAKKLTPEERAEKVRRRVQKDATNPTVHIAVFRLTNMEATQEQLSKKRMVKMLLTAKKLLVNGRCIVVKAPLSVPTMVFVEGGPKSIRKFTRLMLQRINWSAKTVLEAAISRFRDGEEEGESDDNESSDSSSSSSSSSVSKMDEQDGAAPAKSEVSQRAGVSANCALVWKGTSTRREFDGFRRELVDSALDAKQLLQSKNLAYLWDIVETAPAQDQQYVSLQGLT